MPARGLHGRDEQPILGKPLLFSRGASPAIVFTENWVGGPAAVGRVFSSVFNNQLHFTYRDLKNNVQDIYWDENSGNWVLQQLTTGPATLPGENIATTPGPAAGSDVFSSVFNNQLHFTYRDLKNNVQDIYWDENSRNWVLQKLAGP
jgi:hypothetical protein